MDRILKHENPVELIRRMSNGDFFWFIKRVGEEDSLPLLALASEEQWQYLLDLDIWSRDRIDTTRGWDWFMRLHAADPERLVKWAFGEGRDLLAYLLYRTIQVVSLDDKEKAFELGDDYLSLDGLFYVKVRNQDQRDFIWEILRALAGKDLRSYMGLLQAVSGLQAHEMEEEIYRFRNTRLQAYGFIPQEEALSIYAPLDQEGIGNISTPAREMEGDLQDESAHVQVPLLPLSQTPTDNLLLQSIANSADPLFLERMRIEFAGLCNQILSAEGLKVEEFDDLIRTCKRAASYANLGLERLCGKDIPAAEKALRSHPLSSLFRVGFGLALKLKWETERWLAASWFVRQGLGWEFWGEHWGGTLAGIMKNRPQMYIAHREPEEFRDFEWISDLGEFVSVLRRLMVIDGLIERLAERVPWDKALGQRPELTFLNLLFNLWSRSLLSLEPSFLGISKDQAKGFFDRLRKGEKGPPYRIGGFKDVFIKNLMGYASNANRETQEILEESLSLIWDEFVDEYEMVASGEIDGKYSRFITIEPSRSVQGQQENSSTLP
ncbi:MAG: hypothetical protein JRJ29_15830 [Deltaproteobacteria bacterium]|nr:hypothetical protein [Deltaproteobacteria bacterium]